MNSNVLAGLACCAALALGACSGGSSATSGRAAGDPGAESGGAASPAAVTAVRTANTGEDADGATAMQTAERLVAAATSAAQRAVAQNTPAARTAAREAIAAARRALDAAVTAAQAAVDAADGAAALGAAQRSLEQANAYKARTETALDGLGLSYAWYGRDLVRYTFANGAVQVPKDATNTATIVRIPRTVTVDGNQVANTGQQEGIPKAFDGDTFSLVTYEDGKRVFSVADDADGGDEFLVDGYVAVNANHFGIDRTMRTALKLTDEGIVIRTGGTAPTAHLLNGDYTDTRKDLTKWANASIAQVALRDSDIATPQNFNLGHSVVGQNAWDLEITFDEPRTRSVVDRDTSWTGNGDFYWKSRVLPHPSQLNTDGENYNRRSFYRRAINTVPRADPPEGYRDLGTYEVWLSNHVGVDTNLEPAPGAGAITCPDGTRGLSCPDDDDNRYLQYSAYGLFLYTASRTTFREMGGQTVWWDGWNGHIGRINTLHIGYSAFADEDGKRTTDIGEAITNGIFRGYTLVHQVVADHNTDEDAGDNAGAVSGISTKFLRGDATLTVNIPKGSGSATVVGTMNNFQEWYADTYWKAVNNVSVALNSATINADGTFNGGITISGQGGFKNSGNGNYKGSFYGPRADKNDLEIAGSWSNGIASGGSNNDRTWFGAFGAKQVPPTSD